MYWRWWKLLFIYAGFSICLLYTYQLPIGFLQNFHAIAGFVGLYKISAKSDWQQSCSGISLVVFFYMVWFHHLSFRLEFLFVMLRVIILSRCCDVPFLHPVRVMFCDLQCDLSVCLLFRRCCLELNAIFHNLMTMSHEQSMACHNNLSWKNIEPLIIFCFKVGISRRSQIWI